MQKNLDRTMEAEDVTLLRNLIDMSLRGLIKESQMELVMLVGVDGRIFAQVIPNTLTSSQYSLFNYIMRNGTFRIGMFPYMHTILFLI
jgi:hypothetical protein